MSDQQGEKTDFIVKPHQGSKVKKVIGIVSGKGGVGKSLVTSLLAVESVKRGYKTAILDADITGPSIPKAFGITQKVKGNGKILFPESTNLGIKVMSLNLLTSSDTEAVVWRGPVIAGVVTQFWSEVDWGDIDYMFIDMPPGTGDVPLTVFQSIPLDGVVIVTSPQELVGMIVGKAVNMAHKMNIPIIALVENISYAVCPCCNEKFEIFGASHSEEIADAFMIDELIKLPVDNKISAACDSGRIEFYQNDLLKGLMDIIEEK